MSEWIRVEQRLPEPDRDVLIANSEGIEVARYSEVVEDGVDEMGHDAGFIGYFAFPSRSFGNPAYFSEARFQPSHWMPLPEYPDLKDDPLR